MHWIIEIWYYGQEEDNLNELARTVLHILLFTMFCCFQRERMGSIQEFQSMVLNLENKRENARQRDGEERAHSQVVSDTCYYAYRLHVRDGPQPPLFYGGKLFQQFVINAWANCEQRKLNWARTHQHTLRSELSYDGK